MDDADSHTFSTQLYEQNAAKLLAYIHGQIASLSDAEDLLLDVFLTALQDASTLQQFSRERQQAWLWAVARNRVIDFYRRQGRRPAVPLEYLVEIEDSTSTPEQHALRSEEYAELRHLIRQLPRQQQEVLTLRFLAELPCSAIALNMHKNESAIRTMLSRAVNTLRRLFREQSARNE